MSKKLREKYIISVDDFGIRNVSDTILPLVEAKKVDRVAVLVNYSDSTEHIQRLKDSGVKIDIHLELIHILGSGHKIEENALMRGANFAFRYVFGFLNAKRVEQEWIDQIEKFKELFGRYPDGLNSHEHVHYFPRFFEIIVSLSDRYNISFVRFPRKRILSKSTSIVARILDFFWKSDYNRLSTHDKKRTIETPDFFVSFDWIRDFDAFDQSLPEGRTEILFHPEKKYEYDMVMKYF